jgi:predicted nuclease of predicted toxin-antitoxin system
MKFVFDECLSDKTPKALEIMGKDTISSLEVWGRGAADTDWIPDASKRGWCVITSDQLRPHRRLALTQQNGRFFVLTSKNLSPWEQFKLIVNKWEDLEKQARKRRPPYVLRVPKRGSKFEEIRVT